MQDSKETEFSLIRLIEDQPIDDLERDHLGLMPWAKMIAGAVVGTPGPFTIGVHGQWGYGKTTLLRLAQRLIEKHHKNVVTVWFNAWQFEREEHPLFPLVAAIADEIENKTEKGKLQENLQKVGLSLRALARGMKFQGEAGIPLVGKVGVEFDAQKALDAEELLGKQTNPLQAEMLYHSAFKLLEETARGKDGKAEVKIAVFVDDLDRCHPDKAVFLLESIKLILSQPGFVFTLAVDRGVIENYLEKRYAEEYGVKEGDRGRHYLDKIIQLPIHIPSHRTRFQGYVEKVVADLAERHGDKSEPIEALKNIKTVIAIGAGTNPRGLVRLVNNFLLDCTLWPLIRREDEKLKKYQNLDEDIAAALAFNRILQTELPDLYDHLIGDQELCGAISNNDLEKYAAAAEPGEGPPTERREWQPAALEAARARIVRRLLALPDLLKALRTHGAHWLRSEDLRRAVYEFAQTERAEAAPAEFPEPLADAVRNALGLGKDEPIPATHLSEVKSLHLSGTGITDADLEHLKGLLGLLRLYLDNTSITDTGLDRLKALSSLQTLDLGRTKITNAGLPHLKGLSDLNILSLYDTEVTDTGLEHLKGLSGLQGLNLRRTRVMDAGLQHVKGLSGLHKLDLGRTRVTDAGLQHLKGLSGLQKLDLISTRITDAGLEHLKGLSALLWLDVAATEVTDAGLEHLKGLSDLKSLYLINTGVTDAGAAKLRKQIPGIEIYR